MARRSTSRRWTRHAAAAMVVGMAAALAGCHGDGYYAVHGRYHGGHYQGYGGHYGASGDAALVLLAFYGVAAILSWCFE